MARVKFLWLLALLSLLGVSGCGDRSLLLPEQDESTGFFRVEKALPNGLVHTLFLSHAEVAQGDTLRLVSFISNRGDAPVEVTVRYCDLDIDSKMDFLITRSCAEDTYSTTQNLAPGHHIRKIDITMRLRSRPGVYRMRVRHLLDPELWLPFDLRVRSAE